MDKFFIPINVAKRMELLPEIWRIMVPYFTLEQLNLFRMLSSDHCEYTKDHEAPDEVAYPNVLDLFFRCYPKIKRLNTEYCFVDCPHFRSFAKVEELSIQSRYLVRDTLFKPCVQLKKLCLSCDDFHQDNMDSTFQYLTQLTHLSLCNVEKVTGVALFFTSQLEALSLSGRCSISSFGILQLKHLKKLSIDTVNGQSPIRDDAFEGLPIEELVLHHHDFITDQGICHLKQLRKVVCVKVGNVQGEGWHDLKKLETIGIGGILVKDVSNFKMAKTLSFNECRILGPWRGLWRKLEKLRVHNTTFEYPDSIKTILCPRLRKIRIIRCRQMMDYEDLLCKTFGKKLSIH
jgi:hypothetical protein